MSARQWLVVGLALLLSLVSHAQPPPGAELVRVARVVDGDTVVLLGSHEYVRYLGVDTPEMGEPYYYVALRVNRQLVLRRDVYLEFGPQRRDGYGRLLAYLWVQRDGEWILVNEELLRCGVARLYVFWPREEKYYLRFLRAVTLAQVEKRALWSKFPDPLPLSSLEADPVLYLTEAVTVLFTVERVERGQEEWLIYAADSAFGFHLRVWPEVWEELALSQDSLSGQEIQVAGQLAWTKLLDGPYIEVLIPEQWLRAE